MPVQSLFASSWVYDFLKSYEKFRPTAYLPTKNDVWTIGWGHTHGVKEGDTCTSDQGEAWLSADMAFAVAAIHKYCEVPLQQHQFDALVSFVFNIGETQFLMSHLLKYLNAGDYGLAAAEFPKWDKQKGVELGGLLTRRLAEQKRFLNVS